LFQHCVRGMARFDAAVDRELNLCDGAEPMIMIAPAMPYEVATGFLEALLESRRVVAHDDYAYRCALAVNVLTSSNGNSSPSA